MLTDTSCALLTSTMRVIAGASPTWTTMVTGIPLLGKYLKCTVTASHVASTPVTSLADAGSAAIAPTSTQSAIAPARTLTRRLIDLRILQPSESESGR
jgi:hypothetical protein